MWSRYMGMARQTVLNAPLKDAEHLDKRPFDLRGAKLSQQIKAIQWPDAPEQINPAFIDDIAQRVAAAIPESEKTNKAAILSIINNQIEDRYKKPGEK